MAKLSPGDLGGDPAAGQANNTGQGASTSTTAAPTTSTVPGGGG
jgi:hypothetical protein